MYGRGSVRGDGGYGEGKGKEEVSIWGREGYRGGECMVG